MSIRTRLTLWYAAVLTGVLALFGGLIYFSLETRLLGETERELEGTAARFQGYFLQETAAESGRHLVGELREFCQALPPATFIDLRGPGNFQFRHPEDVRLVSGRTKTVHHQFSVEGETFDLDVTTSISGMMHTLQLLRILLFSLTPLVILAASAGGAWLSRRALKPVKEITEAARIIGIENLSQRLSVPGTGDELAKLSEVLNMMFARLERAVKTLSQFVGDASHELRTPIAVIRTTAELSLRRTRSPESYRTSLEQITAESERMTQLVEDLLTLARNDTHTAEVPLAPLEISELLEEVCQEMSGLAELRGIEIQTELTSQSIMGNRTSLHRLFLVLLDNAIKYSNQGGQVQVRAIAGLTHIRISVEDFGCGIDELNLPHIFKRFYRVDPARTGHGHGLGLSLAESIAKAHGATIEVESRLGIGSRFQVALPLGGRALGTPSGNLQLSYVPSGIADSSDKEHTI
jgi:heavy metal sensor kinase